MWVETKYGMLVNLNKIERIMVTQPYGDHNRFSVDAFSPVSEDAIRMFEGAKAECQDYLKSLKKLLDSVSFH